MNDNQVHTGKQIEQSNLVTNIVNEFFYWAKKLKYESKKENLGLLGEITCRNIFGGILSYDKYDSEKDIIHYDNKISEIKVCIYFRKTNKFQINNNKSLTGVNKLKNSDRLFFVERIKPNVISIYECINRKFDVGLYGSDIVSDIDNFKCVYSISNDILYDLYSKLSDANENYYRHINEIAKEDVL